MLPTEEMVHEYRKEMLRIADAARLARLAQTHPSPLTRWWAVLPRLLHRFVERQQRPDHRQPYSKPARPLALRRLT